MLRYTLFIFVFTYYSNIFSQIQLSPLWQDGMVLQREYVVTLSGKATPNTSLSIDFRSRVYHTSVQKDSAWNISLYTGIAGGPFIMEIRGEEVRTLRDIWVGDVWVCGGQSNMELTMERLKDKYPEEIKGPAIPQIRQFTVPQTYNFHGPCRDLPGGNWISVEPGKTEKFSGVAYFFASRIFKETGVPIGLIVNALGGSPAQAWISGPSLEHSFPEYFQEHLWYRDSHNLDSIVQYNVKIDQEWYQAINNADKGLKEKWWNPLHPKTDWKALIMPALWKEAGLQTSPGSLWLHKVIEVPEDKINSACRLFLGCIVDADSVYVNGHFVGTTSYQYPPRKYLIPPGLLKSGKNEITIRVLDQNGRGGFVKDKPYGLLYEDGTFLDISGTWLWKKGGEVSPIKPQVFIRWKSGGLYNTMVHPLFSYPVKGVLWYQGESNTKKPGEYYDLMSSLIQDWRSGWNNPELPFYYVQLANFMESKPGPTESAWAELRDQQRQMLNIPHTGMAVTIDIGEWNDIHPLNKKDVGQRLALIALHHVYDRTTLEYSGPKIKEIKRDGPYVFLDFDHASKGLNNEKKWFTFELAGENKKFYQAEAFWSNDRFQVFSTKVPEPAFIRYAWDDNPTGANLSNTEGLPASPFEFKIP